MTMHYPESTMKYALPLLLLLAIAPASHAMEPINVGAQKQLFIDQRFIASSENITLQPQPAQKLGLLLDQHGARVHGHLSGVSELDGKVRLYVGADKVELLESSDGLTFARTGKTIGGGIFTTVFHDTHDPDPARRYKAFWLKLAPEDKTVNGVYAAYSADGEQFTEVGRVLPYYPDNPTLVMWDDRISKYVIFTRALEADAENERRIARIETDDPLKPWPVTASADDGLFLTPRNVQVVLQTDEHDDPFSDFYYNSASIYPWAQDVYLMFPAAFRHFAPQRQPFIRPRTPGQWEDYGLLEVQLAVSRDGIAWTRPSREAYFPTGLADEWDRWYAVMAPAIARRGNYLYQYYNSSGRTHDSLVLRAEYDNTPEEPGGIGIVRQRLDGFVAAYADHQRGWLETPPITFTGSRLRLNIDTGSMGTARVEIRSPDGNPIPGYTISDCEEIGGNFIDQTVYWNGNPDLSSLHSQPITLRIEMNRARLYAFQFTEN